jgi:hypothetical protein
LTGHADGQPAHEPEIPIGGDLEPQLADVEIQRLVLVGDLPEMPPAVATRKVWLAAAN